MRTIFFNVDTQKDFMNKDGKLYIQGVETIKDNLNKLTNFAKKEKITVVNTADYHTKDSKEISKHPDFKTTFPEHCMAGTDGQDFINETYPKCLNDNCYILRYSDANINEDIFNRARNIIINKDAFDVFEGNKLTEKVLELLQPKYIVVYGVATNICVDFAIKGLLARNYRVIVIVDAIKELPNISTEKFLKEWKDNGAILFKTNDYIRVT